MVLNKSIKVLRRWRPTRSVLLECKTITDESLLFESGSLARLKSSEADLIRKEYPDIDSAYALLGILQVGQKLSYVVMVTGCTQVGKISDTEVYRVTSTLLVPLHSTPCQHEGVTAMGKLLASGQFYFSVSASEDGASFSLLSRAQLRGGNSSEFCWNRSLYVYLERFGIDCEKWVTPLMCGSIQIQTVYAGDKQVKACLVSRVSCERAGTRFNVRGLNDEGSVANFVESEQLLYMDGGLASFIQVRGLVPVFWDQPGIQTGTNRVRLSRGFHCSHPAFVRHFEKLLSQYGPCFCVDLLGNRDMEPLLSEAYTEHLRQLELPGAAEYIQFDYHLHCRPKHTEALESILLPQCSDFLDNCSYYLELEGELVTAQTGTLRVNCLDCLDRSNTCQALFGMTVLPKQLEGLKLSSKASLIPRFKTIFQQFWAQNGDNISKLYAGTRSLGSSSKVSKLRNSARSVQRTIVNNFMDSSKQEAIDLLLLNGYVGPIGTLTRNLLSPIDLLSSLPLRTELTDRWQEYTVREKITVCIGSWNVNGGKHMRSIALKNHSMHDWLLDAPIIAGKKDCPVPDVYAIGFQELVGLTASNLVSTSSSNRHAWGAELRRVLSRDHEYSLLTAEQLVGVCLYIFVRPHLVPFIRDVGVSAVKTGIGGKAGNKGGVAIRFLLHSTSLCFVASHFAAHQTKVMERNQDFAEIHQRVQFPMNQSIDSHDYVFWCGDLNYRIDLPFTIAKDTIAKQDWEKLVRHDQLTKQKKLGKVFQGFAEGDLNFAPTYKYDEFSDDYDTSEKCRVPAWCDRILWQRKSFLSQTEHKGRNIARLRDDTVSPDLTGEYGSHPSTVTKVYERELKSENPALSWWHPGSLLHYGRSELKTSDHRPIIALIEIDVFRVNERERERIRGVVLEEMGPADASVRVKPVGGAYNELNTVQLVKSLHQFGEITLVRVTNEETFVTFRYTQSANAAVEFSGQQVDGIEVEVKLSCEQEYPDSIHQLLTAAQLESGENDYELMDEFKEELSFAVEDEEDDMNHEFPVPDEGPEHTLEHHGLELTLEGTYDDPSSGVQLEEEGEIHSEEEEPIDTTKLKPTRPPRPPSMKSLEISDPSSLPSPTTNNHHSTAMKPKRPPRPLTKPRSATEGAESLATPITDEFNRSPNSSPLLDRSLKQDRPHIPNRPPSIPDRPHNTSRPPPPSIPDRPHIPSRPPSLPERPPPPYATLYPKTTTK